MSQNVSSVSHKDGGHQRIVLINRLNICDAAVLFDLLVLALFFLTTYLTPVVKKMWSETLAIGITLSVLFVLRYVFFAYARALSRKSAQVFLWGQFLLTLVWTVTWGSFSAIVLMKMSLGWTSYFLTVSTLAVAAAYVLLHATSSSLTVASLIGLIVPSVIANAIYVPGLRGQATLTLLLVFWFMLMWLGIKHNRKVLEVLVQKSRMAAVLEAIPGTICWFDSTMKLLGGNSNFYSLFASEGFSAIRSISDISVDPTIRELAESVIGSDQEKVNGARKIADRSYYLVGQKYRFGNEALIVGIDITAQESLNQELEIARSRSYEMGKIAEANQLMKLLIREEKSAVATLKALSDLANDEDKAQLWMHIHALHRAIQCVLDQEDWGQSGVVSINELAELIDASFSTFLQEKGITFMVNGLDDVSINAHPGGLLLCFSILIHNAVGVLSAHDCDEKRIRIRAAKEERRIHFYVEDNGPGIDETYADMIFEPYITTGREDCTGLGLAIMNEIVYSYGGTTGISRLANPTRFFIDLPINSVRVDSYTAG